MELNLKKTLKVGTCAKFSIHKIRSEKNIIIIPTIKTTNGFGYSTA